MKHYILVYAQAVDKSPHDGKRLLENFGAQGRQIAPPSATIVQLSNTAWLLERKTGGTILAQLVQAANNCQLEAKIRFVSEEE